ncbi:MAG: translocation/assembly module TamB domain-containing protein [Acidobacteria bacterium]|nr:translocation/assembly module TamB domain-containing protein [Acidobacteriota bacterium]
MTHHPEDPNVSPGPVVPAGAPESPETGNPRPGTTPGTANRGRLPRVLRLLALLTLLGLSLVLLVHSHPFKRFLFSRVSAWLHDRHGVTLSVEEWDFSLLDGSIRARNLYLLGGGRTVFTRVAALKVHGSLLSVLRGEPEFDAVEVAGADVSLGLPSPLLQPEQAREGKVGIRIRNLKLSDSRVRLRSLEIPLGLDAGSFDLDWSDLPGKTPTLALRIVDGRTRMGPRSLDFRSIAVRAVLGPDGTLDLRECRLDSPVLRWEGTGRVGTTGTLPFRMEGRGTVDLAHARALVPALPLEPEGTLSLDVHFHGDREGFPTADGTLHAANVRVNRVGVRDFDCRIVTTENGRVALSGVRLDLSPGGTLGGDILLLPDEGKIRVGATVESLDLGPLLKSNGRETFLGGLVAGRVEMDVPFTGSPAFRFEGTAARPVIPLPNDTAPFRGESLRAKVEYTAGTFRFDVESIRGEGVTAASRGRYQGDELWLDTLSVSAPQGDDARRLLVRIVKFSPKLRDRIDHTAFRGPLGFSGKLHLLGTFPDVEGTFDAGGVAIDGTDMGRFTGAVLLDRGKVRVTGGHILDGPRALEIDLLLLLEPRTRLASIDLDLAGGEFRWLEKLMEHFDLSPPKIEEARGWDGTLRGRLSLSLPEDKPWQGGFDLTVDGLRNPGHSFGTLSLAGSLAGSSLSFDRLALRSTRYRLSGKGTLDAASGTVDLRCDTDGLPLGEIPVIAGFKLGGVLRGEARLRGQLPRPKVSFDLNAREVSFHGEPFGNLQLKGESDGDRVRFDLRTRYQDNAYQAGGTLRLGPEYLLDCQVRLDRTRISPFLHQAGLLPGQGITGEISGDVHFAVPLNDLTKLSLKAKVSDFSLRKDEYAFRNAEPVELGLDKGVLRLAKARFLLNDAPLSLEGDYPVFRKDAMILHVEGDTRLQVFKALFPEIRANGQVRFAFTLQGDPLDPTFSGQADISDASVRFRTTPIVLDRIRGHLELTRRSIRLQGLEFSTPGGRGVIDGECVLERFKPVRWNFQVRSEHLFLRLVEGFVSDLSVDLKILGTPENSLVGGDVRIERFAPTRDTDVIELVRALSAAASAGVGTGETGEMVKRVKLNINIHGDRTLAVSSPSLTFTASADLQVKGDVGSPAVRGNISVNSGDLKFGSNRFTVERGLLLFNRANGLDPEISFQLTSEIKDYRVSIILEGSLSKVRARFVSVPSLSSLDVVRLISTGMLPSVTERSASETYRPDETAGLLGQVLSETVGRRLKRVVGIDTFALSAYSADPSTAAKAQVTLGKQVSRDLFVTYTRSMNSENEDLIYMEYRISPNLMIIGTRDEDGYVGVDFRFKKRFR